MKKRLVYYAEKGITVLTKTIDYEGIDRIVKTVWNKNDFSEITEKIMEVAKIYVSMQ